jgi:hypothetical protein
MSPGSRSLNATPKLVPALFLLGNLRMVVAISRSSFFLIALYICLEAPPRDDLQSSPRSAASAAPTAICCFLGSCRQTKRFRVSNAKWICSSRSEFSPEEVNRRAAQHDQNSNSRRGRCKPGEINN